MSYFDTYYTVHNEMPLRLVVHNPFRILGVFANASWREITANKTKLVRYATVGKSLSFQADMDSLLPPLNRTVESVEKAFSELALPQDRLKYALFWFSKDTALDEMALNHIRAGHVDEAVEILDKKETWSSIVNMTVLAFVFGEYDSALYNIAQMAYDIDYDYWKLFVTSICGETFGTSGEELAHFFIDALVEELGDLKVLDILGKNCEMDECHTYLCNKIEEESINRIKAEITKAKNVGSGNANASYVAGKSLMENANPELEKLKKVRGKENSVYGIIADSLAKQVLDCGINFYNSSNDDQYNRIEKAMELQNYATRIAVGSVLRKRCEDNLAILLNINEKLPPKEIKSYVDKINEMLSINRLAPKTFDNTILLVKSCAPYLVAIKETVGADNQTYLSLSTAIANTALSTAIECVNKVQEKSDNDVYNIYKIKNGLKEGWRVFLYLDNLDMETWFKSGRYTENRNTLAKMIGDLNGFRFLNTSFKLPYEKNVFNEEIKVDLDMRTEKEVYDAVMVFVGAPQMSTSLMKSKLEEYLKKFPQGKYKAEVEQKLSEIETIRWNKCDTLKDYDCYLREYPHGRYVAEAKQKFLQIGEEELWKRCKAVNSIESYERYLSETRLSKYTLEADRFLEQLRKERRKEKEIWEKCENKKDYKNYLKTYPNGIYRTEAEDALIKIAKEKARLACLAVLFACGLSVAMLFLFN